MTWRSLLYVPVTQRRFVEKALTVGADAIQLDLEDSIAPSEKDEARKLLPEIVDRLAAAGADVVVRINRPWRLAVRDLEAAVRPGVCALALPKVPSAEHVQACAEIVTELEDEAGLAPGSVRFIVMIETAAALFRAREIAAADPRVLGLVLGTEDFATDVGIAPDPDLLTGPNQTVVIAARAAGVLPLGLVGTLAEYRDEAAFGDIVARSRRLGYVGASAIHPRQVPLLNAGFAPTPEEFDQASRLVAAYQDAHARGVGAIEFEGRMVVEPVAQRARALVSQFSRYRETGGSGLP
jgi:citrate lyase subunit beta/citryl-CoA lyase